VSFSCRTPFIPNIACIYGAETSSFKKPCNLLAALAFSSIPLRVQTGGFHSPVFCPPAVHAALAFSSIQRGVHTGDPHSPVFSAPPVLIHISEPEKRLINGSRLFVYSINRFHFDSFLIFKKNFEIYPDSIGRYPGDFTGHHMAFPCRWKGDRHGNFLPDRELPGGSNKSAVGADITNRCDKCTIFGFAGRCRQEFIKPLPAAPSSIHIIHMPISRTGPVQAA
jgi:hypothetical protein